MIRVCSRVVVADNSGAKKATCIHILGGTRKRYATVGDKIVVAIKETVPRSNVKKGETSHAVVVRAKKNKARKDGTYIRFTDNAVVLISNNEPRGTRVFNVIAREVRSKFPKIASQAPEIL